jgi:hypothetical protein
MSSILLFEVVMDNVNFILARGIKDIPVPLCSQGWEFPRINTCTAWQMISMQCVWKFKGSFFLMGCVLPVVNGSTWINLTDVFTLYSMIASIC